MKKFLLLLALVFGMVVFNSCKDKAEDLAEDLAEEFAEEAEITFE